MADDLRQSVNVLKFRGPLRLKKINKKYMKMETYSNILKK
ncbi:MAG: hypothetical protein Satyrvirus16_2 [Satyrvirus sp.]|uniref:Uncharacterized protein n=1 Tax=Satyrvirus sp. TaxID=2487771 RepID=A0A3G5ADX7_9VIRU|nr:MAG: hypothetical protein Satyrvirus16_2 [Satyrvirus sp.]